MNYPAPPPRAHPSLSHADPLRVLQLFRSENVGPVTFFSLLRRFGTVEKAIDNIPELAARGGKRVIRAATLADTQHEWDETEKSGARFIVYGAPDYPAWLAAIPDAPPILAVKGNAALWQKPCIALVGARNASANGIQFAFSLANTLGQKGYTVVSGLARGIDAASHRGTLGTGAVGVIAGGIDTIYPPENAALFRDMEKSGAIISEQPLGSAPTPYSFPSRNRIISGICMGVVVVEASPRSGSLITTRFASEQGREVFAVPGSPMDPRARGSNDLLRNGAVMVESAEDVINALAHFTPAQPALHLKEDDADWYDAEELEDENHISLTRDILRTRLSFDPVLVDELIAQCQVTPQSAIGALLELELSGDVIRHAGNKVSLRYKTSPSPS